MYSLKKFKHLDNNYMLVQLDDKVKNNFLSSFLIGIDNKFLKLDIADLNESTDYYKNKLNDKVVKKFAGKKFNKLNKKHLTYLADLCKMNLVIFDLDKLDLKFSTDLNKKNKTVYLFKHGKKEHLLMKQNMRGMVSKLPVGIYEQFGGMPSRVGDKRPAPQTPLNEQEPLKRPSSVGYNNDVENSKDESSDDEDMSPKHLSIVKTTPNSDDINLIEQINLVRLADTIYELNQIDIENKINFIVSLIYDKISDEILDEIDNMNDEQRKNLEYEILKWIEDNIIKYDLDKKNLNIEDFVKNLKDYDVPDSDDESDTSSESDTTSVPDTDDEQDTSSVSGDKNPSKRGGTNLMKQDKPPYNKYEKSDYVHDFQQLRGNKKLHDSFKPTNKRKRGGRDPIKSTYNKILNEMNDNNEVVKNEDDIVKSLVLPIFEGLESYNNNGKMYSTEITSLDAYENIKHLPINEKIKIMFKKNNNNNNNNDGFSKLIDKCKIIYDLIKENKCDYLQFDQGDTKKLLLETPISPDSTIGLTRLRNLPTLIDGAGSSKIDTIIENKTNTNNTNEQYWTEIYNNIFHIQNNPLPLTFSSVDYNRNINSSDGSSDGFKMILNNNEETIKNGFTVDNLKEVMCHITGVKNLQQDDDNEILNLVKNIEGDDNKLQILRKLKFIGDRGQIVSAMKDNDQNFTSRTLLGSGDRIFIAYALEQQEPIIFTNQGITRLYVPNILPNSKELDLIKKELIKKKLLLTNTSIKYNNDPKEYADAIFEAFLKENFQKITDNIILQTIEITITNEEIKDLIMSTFINFIDNPDIQFKLLKDEILNLDMKDVNSFSINNTDFNTINNERSMNNENINDIIMKNDKDENINYIIEKIINKIQPDRPVKNLYKKIKDLLETYALKAINPRYTNRPSSKEEYEAYKIQIISDKNIISRFVNNINEISENLKVEIKNNIKNLFKFKKKAAESIEKIKSYKDEVKSELGDAVIIMNETKLLEYIKNQENQ